MPRPETVADNERRACDAFVRGEIDVDQLERALDHVWSGGMGSEEFPFLPVFEALATENTWA